MEKHTSTWKNQPASTIDDYLLKEDTYFLLLETGDKIIIWDGAWENQDKNSSTYKNYTRN